MSAVSEHGTGTATHSQKIWDEPREVWLMIEGLEEAESAAAREEGGVGEPLLRKECDWCGETSSSGFFVAVGDQNYQVCSICWGRSPAYVDFRREGHSHESACQKLAGNRGTDLFSA